MTQNNPFLKEPASLLRLYAKYLAAVSVLSALFLYIAVNYGDTSTIFIAGFLPPSIAGVQVASRAFRLGREYERSQVPDGR